MQTQRIDIYNLSGKLDRYMERIKQDPGICEENRQALLDFFNHLTACGLSKARLLIYANRLLPIARMLTKPFRQATKADIESLVAEISTKKKKDGNDFTDYTKQFYKVSIKKFYKWLEGNNETYPDKVKWIPTSVRNHHLLPESLLTQAEVLKMIEAAPNPRDKAFIAVLHESGGRIGEIAGLRIKNVAFDKHGAQIVVDGKTGQRRVRLIWAVNYLTPWLGYHPWRSEGDAPLWPRLTSNSRGRPMTYTLYAQRLKKIAELAGVEKRINPHSFRHSRATQLASMGLSEAQLSAILGWVPSTRMAGTYVHLSGRDTDNALLKAYGLPAVDEAGERLKCARCSTENLLNSKFCASCGGPLSTCAAIEVDEKMVKFEEKVAKLMGLIESDKETQAFLTKRLATKLIG